MSPNSRVAAPTPGLQACLFIRDTTSTGGSGLVGTVNQDEAMERLRDSWKSLINPPSRGSREKEEKALHITRANRPCRRARRAVGSAAQTDASLRRRRKKDGEAHLKRICQECGRSFTRTHNLKGGKPKISALLMVCVHVDPAAAMPDPSISPLSSAGSRPLRDRLLPSWIVRYFSRGTTKLLKDWCAYNVNSRERGAYHPSSRTSTAAKSRRTRGHSYAGQPHETSSASNA